MPEKSSTPFLTQAQKTNLETAKIGWEELQRFFAQGLLIVVDPQLDLVEIAAAFVADDSDHIEQLLAKSQVRKADTEDAKNWNADNPVLWAVVAAPWVLVQET